MKNQIAQCESLSYVSFKSSKPEERVKAIYLNQMMNPNKPKFEIICDT